MTAGTVWPGASASSVSSMNRRSNPASSSCDAHPGPAPKLRACTSKCSRTAQRTALSMTDLLRNILLGISLAAPIGPAGLAVIQAGLRHGFLRAFITGLGVTLADTTYLLLVFFGLSGLIGIPLVKVLIWSLGALVLIYLGVQSIRDAFHRVDLDK